MLKKISLLVLFFCMFSSSGKGDGGGEILIVFGSDTSIWDGMSTNTFHDNYNLQLFVDPTFNAYKVMDAAWRQKIKDSYGQTVKFTWWMMAGNIFRQGINVNVPIANTMGLYLMKTHHGNAIRQFGDELSLHYHTFWWTDYNGDGKYYWNQAKTFLECKDDFNFTLAQYLLEENTFPVSFRSGWHYMDNDWQNYIDSLLPYSMHDDYPAKRFVTEEPIDNVFDWSMSSPKFVPFHPSKTNYQLPGTCKGWNLRSKHIGSVNNTLLTQMFTEANKGNTQVACLWGHLPEDTFLSNIENIDKLAHELQLKYPNVKFRYCSAIEAMQRYLKSIDSLAPKITFTEKLSGTDVTYSIQLDEPIFQKQPFVAVKDIYERFIVIPCKQTGANLWETTQSFPKKILAKAGVAVTDTVGNLSTTFIKYLPDDIFVDNKDAAYTEFRGSWETKSSNNYFSQSLRSAIVAPGDSAIVDWKPVIATAANYTVFYQTQSSAAPIIKYSFIFYKNSQPVDTVKINSAASAAKWFTVATKFLEPGCWIRTVFKNNSTVNATAFADVLKFSPLVKDKQIILPEAVVNLGTFTEMDTVFNYILKLSDNGIENLTIKEVTSSLGIIKANLPLPLIIPGNTTGEIPLKLISQGIGKYSDTLLIKCDDPVNPAVRIPCVAEVSAYFESIDNEDTLKYVESGKWYYSNAHAAGLTSRYSWLSDGPGSFASYKAKIKKTGSYEFSEIVPTTVNSSTKALYQVKVNNKIIFSSYLDQNAGSGLWVPFGKAFVLVGDSVEVIVINDGSAGSASGVVLRADAIKIQFLSSVNGIRTDSDLPTEYALEQNYPNPFNSTTTIRFRIPKAGHVSLKVFDILGRCVSIIYESNLPAGKHSIPFSANELSSGIYIVKFQAGSYNKCLKIMMLK